MNYKETLDFLYHQLPMYQRAGKAAYKANLDNTLALDNALEHPHEHFKTIHIAGTNGKGSVSHMLDSVLQEAGYKTGLYTSPHLEDFRERIRVDGKMIPEHEVSTFVEKIHDAIIQISPSFFEMTVAMAFDYFKKEKIDAGIIETGMGGRLDSTNIIEPVISVITNISLDHTEFLGDTIEKIAAEKGGIIKSGVPVITGTISDSTAKVLAEIALDKQTSIIRSDNIRKFQYQMNTENQTSIFHYKHIPTDRHEAIETDMTGSYQQENISVVLAVIDQLRERNWDIPDEAIVTGLKNIKKNTGLRGRWEIIGNNPRIVLDTAHNEAGILAVMTQLKQTAHKKLHIVWGMVGDKPVEKILSLLPGEASYYFTEPSIPRALSLVSLIQKASNAGLTGSSYANVHSAFHAARKAAGTDDTIYIGGSTFVVADLLSSFNK